MKKFKEMALQPFYNRAQKREPYVFKKHQFNKKEKRDIVNIPRKDYLNLETQRKYAYLIHPSHMAKRAIIPVIEALIAVVLIGLGGVGMYSLSELLKSQKKKKYFKFGREKKRKSFKSYKKRKFNFIQKKFLKIALGEYSTAIKRKPSKKQRKIIYRDVKKVVRGKDLTPGDIFKLRNLNSMINVQNLIKAHLKNNKKRRI